MEAKLGKIIGENEDAQRDAIHIAVVPLIAGEDFCIKNLFTKLMDIVSKLIAMKLLMAI